jgi:hypothetical protein
LVWEMSFHQFGLVVQHLLAWWRSLRLISFQFTGPASVNTDLYLIRVADLTTATQKLKKSVSHQKSNNFLGILEAFQDYRIVKI